MADVRKFRFSIFMEGYPGETCDFPAHNHFLHGVSEKEPMAKDVFGLTIGPEDRRFSTKNG